MSIVPFKPVGVGQTNSINVFQITFSAALSDVPRLRAWDDYTTSTINNTVFVGTTGSGNLPLIAGVGGVAPGIATWFPNSAIAGDSTAGAPNFLKGTANSIRLSISAPGAGSSVPFNLGYKIPSDVTTLAVMAAAIVCEYQYTGSAPSVTFSANSGTESSPIWNPLESAVVGIAPVSGSMTKISPCDYFKGFDGDQTYRLTIPNSGSIYPNEIWVRNY